VQLNTPSLGRAATALAAALLVVGAARVAEAYPQFQYSTGNTRCSMCHISPVGGGLINSYGRYESSASISAWGGDGDFLHGLVDEPKWLHTGADFRVALAGRQSHAPDPEVAAFPMQGDIYGNAKFGDFSVAVTLGVRAQVRQGDSALSRIVSREHYVMWRPKTKGPYVRAGRFFPTYGLRLPNHTSYLRRFGGQYLLEEKLGVGAGMVEKDWELHATAFAPAMYWSAGRDAYGGTVYYERRLGDKGGVGVQSKVSVGDEDSQYWGGAIGKWYLDKAKLLVQGEVDVGHQSFAAGDAPGRNQLNSHLELALFPMQGLMVSAAVERYDEDLSVADVARDAASLTLQLFPRAHWEVLLMGKLQAQGGDYGSPSKLGLLMLHYYL
jgi:hypothetical protein